MAPDLIVAAIHLPAKVIAGCATPVQVDVVNKGTSPSQYPFDVCLDISVSIEGQPAVHETVRLPTAESQLQPGAMIKVNFLGVRFPCASSVLVAATADCGMVVPLNIRSNPKLTVPVGPLGALPWLWTGVRVGLQDSSAYTSWDPTALCPGVPLVVEVSLSNKGCAAASATLTTVDVIDGAGQVLFHLKQSTAPISAGASTVVAFPKTLLPTGVAGNQLTIRACADANGVLSQCDTLHACDEVKLALATTAAKPQLTFLVNGDILPGCPASITWRIKNFCSDLVWVTAKVSFLGNVLYQSSPFRVGMQGPEQGEDNLLIVPTLAAANSFYKIGTKSLQLELVGTGNDPGPYKTNAQITVAPEPVSGSLWAFTAPAPGMVLSALWKAPYALTGRLSNAAACSLLSPISMGLNEVDTSTTPPKAPLTRAANPAIGLIAPGAVGLASWTGITQSWAWLLPFLWTQTEGPTTKVFNYTVSFDLQDQFGNAYPTQTSSPVMVVVSVSTTKVALADVALAALTVAIAFLVAAALALAHVISFIAAGVALAVAGVAESVSLGAGTLALDPPAPDFKYREAVAITPTVLPQQFKALPKGLVTTFELVARILASLGALSQIEGKLIGAAIDSDLDGLRLQAASQQEALRIVAMAAAHLPLAVSDAIAEVRADTVFAPLFAVGRQRAVLRRWRRSRMDENVRTLWRSQGLSSEAFNDLERAIANTDIPAESVEDVLTRLAQAFQHASEGVQWESQRLRADLEEGLASDAVHVLRSPLQRT